jgi:hypothetical protein
MIPFLSRLPVSYCFGEAIGLSALGNRGACEIMGEVAFIRMTDLRPFVGIAKDTVLSSFIYLSQLLALLGPFVHERGKRCF